MRLSEKAISEFKKIYSEELGVDLSKEQANEFGVSLLHLFRLVYRPIPTLKHLPDVHDVILGASK